MEWYWIFIIVFVGSALLNPILYFVYWELCKRKKWIKGREHWKSDDRFFDSVPYWEKDADGISQQFIRREQVAPIRPQVKDVYFENDLNLWVWCMPIVSSICLVCYVCSIIFSPLQKFWELMIEKIANLKV